jgi:hypothetical protein
LVRGGLVQTEQDNLYPVRNPQPSMFKNSEGREAGRWERFFDQFASSDPETALQYRELEKQFNQVKKLIMRRYRAWGKAPEVADSTNYSAESVADSNNTPLQESETDQKTKAAEFTVLTENVGAPSLTLNSECRPSSSSVTPERPTTTMLPPEEDPDSKDIAALRAYLSQNGISNDWEIVADTLRRCRVHSPFCSVEQIVSEIGGKVGVARQADKPMAWLRTAIPKCFIGASIIPITPAGCPMPHNALSMPELAHGWMPCDRP